MATISRQIRTCYPTKAAADALAAQLKADDPETDYRVMQNDFGYFVAIFEDNTQAFTL